MVVIIINIIINVIVNITIFIDIIVIINVTKIILINITLIDFSVRYREIQTNYHSFSFLSEWTFKEQADNPSAGVPVYLQAADLLRDSLLHPVQRLPLV